MSETVIPCEFKKGRADLRNNVRATSLDFLLSPSELVTRAVRSAYCTCLSAVWEYTLGVGVWGTHPLFLSEYLGSDLLLWKDEQEDYRSSLAELHHGGHLSTQEVEAGGSEV